MLREKQPQELFISSCLLGYCQIEETVRDVSLAIQIGETEASPLERKYSLVTSTPLQSGPLLKKKRSTVYWTKVQYTGLPQFSNRSRNRPTIEDVRSSSAERRIEIEYETISLKTFRFPSQGDLHEEH
jgi:hypothetical protein